MLQEITAVDEVLVNITGPGATMCNGSDGSTTRVTFLLQYGALSNMTVDTYTLKSSVATPVLTVFAKGQVGRKDIGKINTVKYAVL